MMRLTKTYLSFILTLIFMNVYTQDIHFSQFYADPMNLNPSMTGQFNGDYRVNLNYKNQWNSVTTPYQTFALGYDMQLFNKKLQPDNLAAGIQAFADKAGDSEYGLFQTNLSLSYTKALDYHQRHHIGVGIQAGIAQRSLNYSKLIFDDQYDPDKTIGYSGTSKETLSKESYLYPDASLGVVWQYHPNKKTNVYAGAAVQHVNRPQQTFFDVTPVNRLKRKLTLHAGGQFKVSEKTAIIPNAVYLKQGAAQELNFGSYVKFSLKDKIADQTAISLGGWYRLNDAIILGMRIDWKNLKVGFTYDINISSLVVASHTKGGPEVSVTYTGLFENKPKTNIQQPKFW